MNKLTESAIEKFVIELLGEQGYEYVFGPRIAPDGEAPERESYADVILLDRLRRAAGRINPGIPAEALEDAVKQIKQLHNSDLTEANKAFHILLTDGVPVDYRKKNETKHDFVNLIDFDNPDNNDFLVVNQFTVIEENRNRRPDIVLFVNGLPLVVMELKNAGDEHATIKSAFNQIGTYKAEIPELFKYNAFTVLSDGLDAKAGTISADFSRFMAWKSEDGKAEASRLVPQIEILIKGMCVAATLLDLIRHFIVFEEKVTIDKKSRQKKYTLIKKMAAYHQYYAVNKAVESTLKAAGKNGDGKGGVVWHTQGSGKSLSMVFYAGKLVLTLDNPTLVMITDRNDLDNQLYDTFAASKHLLRQKPEQAKDREDLKNKLQVASGGIVFTTIQKFFPEDGNEFDQLSDRRNIVVVADEAHRTQYGFAAKVLDERDEKGNIVGAKTVYGFAKYMRDALPNATYLGFTGTPIEYDDKNTPAVFGDYIDIYDIKQAVEDKATVPIYYESRLAKVALSEEGRKLVKELDDELEEVNLSEAQKAKAKWTKLEAIIGSKERIKRIAADIVEHFEKREEVFEGKGMIVAISRKIAVELYNEIIALRPQWHDVIKVVFTANASDGHEMAKHHTSKDQRRELAARMRDSKDSLKLVIVCDMWLTGFDAPPLHTLYIDKPMRGHKLMQAIARVNRVYKEKAGGLVVDYIGIASDLKKALAFYTKSGGKGNPLENQEKAVEIMLEKLEVVSAMFLEKPEKEYSEDYENMVKDPAVPYLGKDKGLLYEEYFTADPKMKLDIILAAQEHILALQNGKKRFIDNVSALSRAFAIAVPHPEAMDVKDEVAFFQAVKARIVKYEQPPGETGRSDEEIETAIKQVIDKALVSNTVIDIFDAAGIKKPDISILSEEFLLEMKDMKYKNVAIEVIRKLLNDEIKGRLKTNMVKSKKLMEMLQEAIKKYQNKILTAAEVIEELIKVAKEIKKTDAEPEELGLKPYEYAFYTAIADNDSARELMQKDKLRELAVVLFETVKNSATIDWTLKESVRAKLKVMVKRTLRKYGYPPDMQKLATETVLKQAEILANELTGAD